MLTKQHLLDLKTSFRPHPLVEKVLLMICLLKGHIAPTWATAKEVLNPLTFKLELSLLDITGLKHGNVLKINTILKTTKGLNKIVNILKHYEGFKANI